MLQKRVKSTKRKWISYLCFFCVVFVQIISGKDTELVYGQNLATVSTTLWEEADDNGTKEEKELPNLQLYAKSALLMDATNRRVLYEKNGYEVMPMASTTKIMTAIIALEYGNLEDDVTISAYAASRPKVRLGMKEGEVYKLKDLLFSLMLESHNDTAVAIAEHIGGSTEGFAELMNQKARDLGCENTYFITPNGLDAERDGRIHSTTAYDLAKIASYAIENDLFVALVGTKNYSFTEQTKGRSFCVNNKDQFLRMMDGAIGIKTGFTNDAGYCFVGAVKKQDRTLVSVVLASGWPPHKNYKWEDTKELMDLGVEAYTNRIIEQASIPKEIVVCEGVSEKVPIEVAWNDKQMLLSDWDKLDVIVELEEVLEAPVEKGQVVGYEKIMVNGQNFGVAPITTTGETQRYTLQYCIDIVIKKFLFGA